MTDCGKFYMTHYITLILYTGKSDIKSLLVPSTVGTVLVYFNFCIYYVCWVAFILVSQFVLGNIFACVRVAGVQLSLTITTHHHCVSENQQYVCAKIEDVDDLLLGWSAVQVYKHVITLII